MAHQGEARIHAVAHRTGIPTVPLRVIETVPSAGRGNGARPGVSTRAQGGSVYCRMYMILLLSTPVSDKR